MISSSSYERAQIGQEAPSVDSKAPSDEQHQHRPSPPVSWHSLLAGLYRSAQNRPESSEDMAEITMPADESSSSSVVVIRGDPNSPTSSTTTTTKKVTRQLFTEKKTKKITRIKQLIGENGEILSEETVEEVIDGGDESASTGGSVCYVSTGTPIVETRTVISGDPGALSITDGGSAGHLQLQPEDVERSRQLAVQQFGELQASTERQINEALAKTQETFQRLLEEKRDKLVSMFPELQRLRSASALFADDAPADDGATTEETIVCPDGTVTTVKRTVRKTVASASARTVTRLVNGQVQSSRTRAFLEYQGPGGGFKVKLKSGANNAIEMDSESEDDEDTRSLAASELLDHQSGHVLYEAGKPRLAIQDQNAMSKRASKEEKAWHAAKELVDSEERYVRKLQLLDQEFRTRLTASVLSEEKAGKIFSNIGSIARFHNDHLLPQLLDRQREWKATQRISDVMRKQAPFLKIYAEYTNNYKKAVKTFHETYRKNKQFAAVVIEIEKLPECDNLPLASHLICPVQRVMRYHLLLQEYLKHLPDEHQDVEDTKAALALALAAANHANEIMRKLDRYKDVLDVQELLGHQINDLVTPSRQLMKRGKLTKISARTSEHQSRTVFLFNDILLLCSDRKMPSLGSKYKLRAIIGVANMQVCEGDRLDLEHTFYVRIPNRCVEFSAANAKEKAAWIDVLWAVISEFGQRQQSFQTDDSPTLPTVQSPTFETSPVCQLCSAKINDPKKAIVCHLCGVVVCKKCSAKRAGSPEKASKHSRVCSKCSAENRQRPVSLVLQQRPKTILAVKASDECIYNGCLQLRNNTNKQWLARFCMIGTDFILYTFKTDKDLLALTALPLPGCEVGLDEQDSASLVFRIAHQNRAYLVKAETRDAMAQWMAALELTANARLPSETSETNTS